ncbi:MAG: helix-turn-helix domain-containing protein [Mycobacteriales bacterium]
MPPDPTNSLVGSYAAHLLIHELDTLSDELVALIRATVPAYVEMSAVNEGELRASCRSNLERALAELAGHTAPGDPSATPQDETGRRRAQQRLPLESLLHSYRLGGRVLWQGLVGRAAAVGSAPDHRQLLTEAGVVWDVIDRHSSIVSRAYREEQGRLQQHTQRRRAALLAALLDGHGLDADVIQEAASTLDMPIRGPRFVVAAALELSSAATLRSADRALDARGFTSAWITQGRQDCGLVALHPNESFGEAMAILEQCAAGPVAISPVVDGFDEVAASYRLAHLTLRTLPADFVGVRRVTDQLPQALLISNHEVARILVEQTLGPVLTLPAADQKIYLDTLEALLACDRSYAAAARRLFCHRNTVLKRAQRLEAITGLRLSRPQDLLHLTLALLAVRTGLHSIQPHSAR